MAGRLALPERPAMWLGHYSMLALLAAVMASLADDATGQRPGVAEWIAVAAWSAWMAASAADTGRHRERLCERCIAASPLDPQAAVSRWRAALRLHHSRKAMITLLSAVVAWDVIDGLLHQPPWWALALSALGTAALGMSVFVTWQHRRLYPWCPFCRWDGGGPHEVSPDVPVTPVAR